MTDTTQAKIAAAREALGDAYSDDEADELARDSAVRNRRALGWTLVSISAAISIALLLMIF